MPFERGVPIKLLFVECPECKTVFYYERILLKEENKHHKLLCPSCHLRFAKEEAVRW